MIIPLFYIVFLTNAPYIVVVICFAGAGQMLSISLFNYTGVNPSDTTYM